MASTMRILCGCAVFAAVAVARAAVEKASVQIEASGAVIRSARTTSTSEVSTFTGLSRSDRYSAHRGLNCSSGHGGANIGLAQQGKSLEQCKQSCRQDDGCTCITHEESTGMCAKHRYCDAEHCVPSSLVDMYLQHSRFQTKVKPKKAGVAVEGMSSGGDDPVPHGGGLPPPPHFPQYQFERSGGRFCTEEDGAHDLEYTGNIDDLSVTQCLTLCQNTNGCQCVKYERYYQSVCNMMYGCPYPTFCNRTIDYDMYVLIPPDAPSELSR